MWVEWVHELQVGLQLHKTLVGHGRQMWLLFEANRELLLLQHLPAVDLHGFSHTRCLRVLLSGLGLCRLVRAHVHLLRQSLHVRHVQRTDLKCFL